MTAPNLALRNCLFVNYVGTDDAGYDAIGKPWSYRSIDAALIALAAQSNPPSSQNPWTIAIGPGVFPWGVPVLPAWVWITGCADGETGQNTTLQLSDDFTLDPNWAAGATKGGLANLVLRAASGSPVIDLTMPAPSSGNPARVLELENVTSDLDTVFAGAANNDALQAMRYVNDSSPAGSVQLSNGQILLSACSLNAALVIAATTRATNALLIGSRIPDLTVSETAPGAIGIAADSISLPLIGNIAFTGTAADTDITRLSDANGSAYTPSTPGDWPLPVPKTVQEALDSLAAGGIGPGGTPNGTSAVTNNGSGNTTVTPTAHTWSQLVQFTGAGGTRIVILDVAGSPAAGDLISLVLSRTDGGGISVEVHEATAGGTLLATFPDGTGTTTAKFDFVYGTVVTGFPADAWFPWSYQIPATT